MRELHYSSEFYSITVVVDNTDLGPSLGGCRIWKYNSDNDAIKDCRRLAQGMTFKNSLCGLNYGGGKAVINLKNADFRLSSLEDLVYMIDFFEGDYITAEDVGTTSDDLRYVRKLTENVATKSKYDASEMTAYGVYMSMKACCKYKYDNDSLKSRFITIQGAGKVGSMLALLCAKESATVYISDLYPEKAIEVANQHENIIHEANDIIHTLYADIYAPCALGATVNEYTIPELGAKIICGCANNQLAIPGDAELLKERGIVYAPDYLVNAGGVLTILVERHEFYKSTEELICRIAKLYDTTLECLIRAEQKDITTAEMADKMAMERLND